MKTYAGSLFKATFAERIRQVQSGESLIITDHNKPIAIVSPIRDELIERDARGPFKPVAPPPCSSFTSTSGELLQAERGER